VLLLRQRLLERLASEQVDAHRRQVGGLGLPGQLGSQIGQPIAPGLLLEVDDAAVASGLHDAKARGLLGADGLDGHGGVRLGLAMHAQHVAEVHAVQLVAAEDRDLAPRLAGHVLEALANGIGRPLEPLASLLGLLGREDLDEARREHVELVGVRDVGV